MNRRTLLCAVPLLAAARAQGFVFLPQRQSASSEVERLLDTTHPERHCQMSHNHNDSSFDDWEGSLQWAAHDCGHNEGAGPVIKLAVSSGLSSPELMYGCHDSEGLIPQVQEAIKNPDALDQFSGWVTPAQLMALKRMLREGKSFPEVLSEAPPQAIGEVWKRVAMMRFASRLAKKNSEAAAVAIATASQWHNCQAFRCLLRHPDKIYNWLRGR
jgi:hypothetical protein